MYMYVHVAIGAHSGSYFNVSAPLSHKFVHRPPNPQIHVCSAIKIDWRMLHRLESIAAGE